jgi:hypothetical protein
MEILSHRETETHTEYRLEFSSNIPGSSHGYTFECDPSGRVDESKLNPCALENYRRCLAGADGITQTGIATYSHSYTRPAVGRCPCGCEVELFRNTNTCDGCGRDFNMSGQELAPREQWGEETGEAWYECL